MKRALLSAVHRWQTLRLFHAQIQADSAERIVQEALDELSRANAMAELRLRELQDARADASRAGFQVARLDRMKALGL